MNEREQIEGRLQEQAAKEADRHTTPAREMAARLAGGRTRSWSLAESLAAMGRRTRAAENGKPTQRWAIPVLRLT